MSEGHGPRTGPVMMFTTTREAVSHFYADIVGLAADRAGDATWFETENAKVVVHERGDRETPPAVAGQTGFVVWFGVPDVRAAYDRARRAAVTASDFFGDYFFARDPDGRYVGIYALEDSHGHDHEH